MGNKDRFPINSDNDRLFSGMTELCRYLNYCVINPVTNGLKSVRVYRPYATGEIEKRGEYIYESKYLA